METFTVRGGMRAGWVHASWPFARLSASPLRLCVDGLIVGHYEFEPKQVVALEAYGVPLLGGGVKIIHTRPDYPRTLVFASFGSSEALVQRIREAGFVPSASLAIMPVREGIAMRWSAVLLAILVWNALFVADQFVLGRNSPGPFALVALALAFLCSWLLKTSAAFQALALKPGRSVGEIEGFLTLLQVISGFMLLVMGVSSGAG